MFYRNIISVGFRRAEIKSEGRGRDVKIKQEKQTRALSTTFSDTNVAPVIAFASIDVKIPIIDIPTTIQITEKSRPINETGALSP